MRFLWEMIGKVFGPETQDSVFLSANVLLWSIGTFVIGALFCTLFGNVTLVECAANLMCAAIYAGVIGGVIGGFVFLFHRHNGEQL